MLQQRQLVHYVPSSDVPCQHGLVRRAGESITHMLRRKYHDSARSLALASLPGG